MSNHADKPIHQSGKKRQLPRLACPGSPEFIAWGVAVAEHARQPIATCLEHALIDYAQRIGYTEPAPKRI